MKRLARSLMIVSVSQKEHKTNEMIIKSAFPVELFVQIIRPTVNLWGRDVDKIFGMSRTVLGQLVTMVYSTRAEYICADSRRFHSRFPEYR